MERELNKTNTVTQVCDISRIVLSEEDRIKVLLEEDLIKAVIEVGVTDSFGSCS